MRKVNVYCSATQASTLTEVNTPEYHFQYRDDYFAYAPMPPVSVKINNKQQTYPSPVPLPLFCNILPEEANRKALCIWAKVDNQDLFGILTAHHRLYQQCINTLIMKPFDSNIDHQLNLAPLNEFLNKTTHD